MSVGFSAAFFLTWVRLRLGTVCLPALRGWKNRACASRARYFAALIALSEGRGSFAYGLGKVYFALNLGGGSAVLVLSDLSR